MAKVICEIEISRTLRAALMGSDARCVSKLVGGIVLARIVLLEQDSRAALDDLLDDNPKATAIVARLRGDA